MAPSHHKRQSIESQFEDLSIAKTIHRTINLPKVLRNTFHAKLASKAKFTLKMDATYDYNRFTPDPEEVFEESIDYFEEVTRLIGELKEQDTAYEDHLVESMIMMIFTSNSLENAGSSHALTVRICKEIFAGRMVSDTIDERDEDYKLHLEYLMLKG